MKKTQRVKKIPILSYLCYLLVVSVLFTGVTFSRYSTATSGDFSGSISPFVTSYEIDNISSNTFSNANFYLTSGAQIGTSRTVRFTMRNYEVNDEGATIRISDVDLMTKLRLYIPAELADVLVLQLTDTNNNAVTPQIVLGNLIYQVQEGTDGKYEYTAAQGSRTYAEHSDVPMETAKFPDYEERTQADGTPLNDTLTVNGSIPSGYLSAQGTFGMISVTRSTRLTQYSVGFRRESAQGDILSQLFLDLEKEVDFYTIDLALDSFVFAGGNATELTYVMHLSLAERIASEDYDYGSSAEGSSDITDEIDLLLEPQAGNGKTFNGATVTGYHFDCSANTFDRSAAPVGTTQIRVQKIFTRNEDGSFTGGSTLAFHHVAPISETTVNYVHPIEQFYSHNGTVMIKGDAPSTIAEAQSLYGVCSNQSPSLDSALHISFGGVTDDPILSETIRMSLSKSYYTQINVVFTQTEIGEGA